MSLLRTQDHALLALGIILASLSSSLSFLVIPAFADVFKGLAHVPAATGILLRFHWLLLLLPLPVLAAWRYWPSRDQRGIAALVTGIAVLLGSQAAIRVILSLPVLELGR